MGGGSDAAPPVVSARHHAAAGHTAPMASSRPDRALLVVLAVIVIAAVAAVWVTHAESDPPPGSPEAVVQELVRRAVAGDPAAGDLIHPDLGCTAQDAAVAATDRSLRVDLLDVVGSDDAARVRIEVTEDAGGPVFDGWRHEESLTLTRSDDAWLVTSMTWPLWCEGSRR